MGLTVLDPRAALRFAFNASDTSASTRSPSSTPMRPRRTGVAGATENGSRLDHVDAFGNVHERRQVTGGYGGRFEDVRIGGRGCGRSVRHGHDGRVGAAPFHERHRPLGLGDKKIRSGHGEGVGAEMMREMQTEGAEAGDERQIPRNAHKSGVQYPHAKRSSAFGGNAKVNDPFL